MILPPRQNDRLVGHDATGQELRRLIDAERLPHGLILAGEPGIGKSTLAFRLAKYLLSPPSQRAATGLGLVTENGAVRRVASGAHGDLIVIDRAEDAVTGKAAKDISVENVRRIAPFLRMTASEGGWRIAIVDEASHLNRAGQNALLKILEEPPARTLIVLVCDRPGMLLPTIHSRCRLMHMPPLASTIVEDLLGKMQPDLSPADVQGIARLAEGSIGRALDFAAHDGLGLYAEMIGIVDGLAKPDWRQVHAFAERIGQPAADRAYHLFAAFLPRWMSGAAAATLGRAQPDVVEGEGAVRRNVLSRTSLDRWMAACEKISERLSQTETANLDRKLAVWASFEAMAQALS